MTSGAASAALRVASRLGYPADDPLVVSETNNTLVWLRPHAVIAKVGTQPHSADTLAREHAVAMALPSDASIARAVPGVAPSIDERSGAVVTLWERIDSDAREIADPRAIGVSLLELHRALATYRGDLPNFLIGVGRAWEVLADDGAMEGLPEDDRSFLGSTFGRLVEELDRRRGYVEQPLHGEPHGGNLLLSGAGPCWIDLENVCIGPLEWDLAFLPEGAVEVFPRVDEKLLELLRLLSSACVATWCWSRPWRPELRRHGELHLARLRDAEA